MNAQIGRMSPLFGLSAVNFYLADVQGGLGPFLAAWLAETGHWDPARIGIVMTISGIAGLIFNAPAGGLVDRLGTPRFLLAAASLAVVAGTLGLLASHAFVPVLVTQIVVAIGGAFMAPGLVALTLGLVGKDGFPARQGRNQAWNHAGNVAAGLAVAGATFITGPASAFWVMAGMAAGSMASLLLIPRSSIHAEAPKKGQEKGSLRAILTDRRLVFLAVALLAFHLGNAAMLPMLGQRMAASGAGNPTRWLAACVIIAQFTMIPVALLAGKMADRVNRAWLLVAACMVLPVRGVLAAVATDP